MKRLLILLLLVVLVGLSACGDSGVANNSPNDLSKIKTPTLLSSSQNPNLSFKYKMLLPMWESNHLNEAYDDVGLQFLGGPIRKLYPAIDHPDAYFLEIDTLNGDYLLNWGRYRNISGSDSVIWLSQIDDIKSDYHPLRGYFGMNFYYGAMAPINLSNQNKLVTKITVSTYEPLTYQSIHLSGATSTPQSEITHYAWNFGDGQTANGPEVDHTYTVAGTYNVQLTVQDNFNHSQTASIQLKVVRPAFPANTLLGGDNLIQAFLNSTRDSVTLCVFLDATMGPYRGRPFWWGTDYGIDHAWVFHDIKPMPYYASWGSITLPYHDGEQFEFTYSGYYTSFNGSQVFGVDWRHLTLSQKFYDPVKGHFVVFISDGVLTSPR